MQLELLLNSTNLLHHHYGRHRAVALGCFIIRCGLMLGLQFDHLLFITFEILFSPGICILKVQILLDPS